VPTFIKDGKVRVMKRFSLILFFAVFFGLIFSSAVYAIIGVGVGTGKIQVEDKLKSGMTYNLPILTVLNTGSEPSNYGVSIAYHQDQPELAPPEEWFDFSPSEFYLEPGESQAVDIKLDLPLKTVPGDYFAYLEGAPTKRSQSGSATIGVAAAAKLYFTIEPANFLEAVYYKTIAFWTAWLPWTNIAAALLLTGLASILFKKFFNVELKLKKKVGEVDEEHRKSEKFGQ